MKFIGSAPGRLDVMGGISDYSGALVLQMPLSQTTEVEIEENSGEYLTIASSQGQNLLGEFEINWSKLKLLISDSELFRKEVLAQKNGKWAIYPLACFAVISREKGIDLPNCQISIQSTVPLGKGVSSSAAIEVATIRAIAKMKNLVFKDTELAVLAQMAENQFVGAPCGLMDQLASAYGENGKLLPILCQPDVLSSGLAIPEGLSFYGIDSGIKHEVNGASYGDVRTAAAMGYAIIAQHLGTNFSDLIKARISGKKSELPFGGYLANISLSDFYTRFEKLLPEKLSGKDFLNQFRETSDLYAKIDPESVFSIRICTQHPIAEHQRTKQFKLLLEYSALTQNVEKRERIMESMGELMFQSHASYSACGLGHPKTNELVEMVRQNLGSGVFGAKITGGGSGGTVCVLSDNRQGGNTVSHIHNQYQEKLGRSVLLIKP